MFIKSIETDSLCHLPTELVDFARRQFVNATLYKGDERRRENRHPMMLPVQVIPVNSRGEAIDDLFDVVTRDVSPTGIGLIHSELIMADYLAIHLTLAGTDVDMMIEVLWSGAMGRFYGAAGKYVRRLDKFPV